MAFLSSPRAAGIAVALVAGASCSSPVEIDDGSVSRPDLSTWPHVAFFSSASLARFWTVSNDRKSLRVTTYEASTEGEHQVDQDIFTSFDIMEIAPRGGDELFVSGHPQRGGFVIERWRIPEVLGSPTARLEPFGTPPGFPITTPDWGVPTQPWSGRVYVPGNISPVPFDQRDPLPPIEKTPFAEDPSTLIRGIGADPEGRFVLVMTDSGELRQYFSSSTVQSHVVLEDSFSFPGIEHCSGLFFRVQHAVFGRVWFLNWFNPKNPGGTPISPSQYQTIVLLDAENDGLFEDISSHLVDGTSIDRHLDRSLWLDWFFMSAP